MKRKVTVRISKLFIFIVAFLFVVIIGKVSYVALSSHVDEINLKEFANNRNTKSTTIYAKRGNIYDKEGNTLASIVNSYTVIAYLDAKRTTNPKKPEHVVDKEETAKILNEVLGIDYEFAMKQLNKTSYQVEFGGKGSNISESVKNKIEAMNLPGIDFISGQKRTYSMGSFASYIIGYAKMHEEGNIVGELGIESFYDKELSGTDGSRTYETDAYGYTLPSAEVHTKEAVDGKNIYLTIDSNIQLFAETLTRNLAENYAMDWMIFTVMDAKTGAIVASSTYPNFNPNDLNTLTNFMNPLVSYEYEPGSTMKTFSFASSIESGKYDGNATFDSGAIEVLDVTIKDFNKTGWGTITYDTGYAYSSNVAATHLALDLGGAKLKDYYTKLGFGSKTGIELANEVKGKINFQYPSEIATASFGQGITVTPIQMLQALTSITNDGTVLKPYIVDKIVDGKGKVVYEGKRTEVAKVYSKETTDYMKKLMHNMVYEGLDSGKYWRPNKTTMIGKTGTAQIADPKGGYLKGQNANIKSFSGIFPEEDPQYIVYVVAKEIDCGSSVIGKELTKAVDDIVSSLGIENNRDDLEKKIVELNNYISEEVVTTVEDLRNKKLNVYVLGSGKYIINQYPLKKDKVLEGGRVFLKSNSHDYVMEDITGWSLSEVMTYVNLLGISLITDGYGYVTSQSIPVGTPLTSDMALSVSFNK